MLNNSYVLFSCEHVNTHGINPEPERHGSLSIFTVTAHIAAATAHTRPFEPTAQPFKKGGDPINSFFVSIVLVRLG